MNGDGNLDEPYKKYISYDTSNDCGVEAGEGKVYEKDGGMFVCRIERAVARIGVYMYLLFE